MLHLRVILTIIVLLASAMTLVAQKAEKQVAEKAKANQENAGQGVEVYPPTLLSPVHSEAAGKVTDENGNSVVGATVAFCRSTSTVGNSLGLEHYPHDVCDDNGEYRVLFQNTISSYRYQYQNLIAYQKGFAPQLRKPDDADLDFQLSRGQSVTGTIKTIDGVPIEGAKVRFACWLVPTNTEFENKDRLPFKGKFYAGSITGLVEQAQTQTDAEGKFTLHHLPSEYTTTISISCQGYKSQLVYVQGTKKENHIDQGELTICENGFSIALEPTATVLIKTGDNSSTDIANVKRYASNTKTSSFNRTYNTTSDNGGFFNIVEGPSKLVVEPDNTANFLGKEIWLDVPENSTEIIERTIDFSEGYPIRGKVTDSETGQGVPGVLVYYTRTPVELEILDGKEAEKKKAERASKKQADNKEQANKEVNFVCDGITDSNGEFQIAVPHQDAAIQLIGPVRGYRCISNFSRVQNQELLNEFQKTFTADQLSKNQPLEFNFELSKASRVSGIATDAEGKPLANIRFSGQRMTSYGYNRSVPTFEYSISGVTDENGRFEFDWYYHELNELELAKPVDPNAAPNPNKPAVRRNASRYPQKIKFFDEENGLGCFAEVPLPNEDNDLIEVTAKLESLATIEGQFVDIETGEGIPGVDIRCSMTGIVAHSSSNENGRFRLVNIFPNSRLYLHPSGSSTKFKRSMSVTGVTAGKTKDLGKFEGLDLGYLAEPLPEFDVSELGNEEALTALIDFTKKQLDRVPWDQKEFFRSRSSTDPIGIYLKNLHETIGPIALNLSRRAPHSDFESEVLCKVFLTLHEQSQNWNMMRLTEDSWTTQAHQILIERHINRKSAQKVLKLILQRHVYYLRAQGKNPWKTIYENCNDWEMKGFACWNLAQTSLNTLVSMGLSEHYSEKEFDEQIEASREYIELVINTYNQSIGRGDQNVGDLVIQQLKNVKRMAMRRKELTPNLEQRRDVVMKLVEQFLDSNPGG